jgi:hypothetical protein
MPEFVTKFLMLPISVAFPLGCCLYNCRLKKNQICLKTYSLVFKDRKINRLLVKDQMFPNSSLQSRPRHGAWRDQVSSLVREVSGIQSSIPILQIGKLEINA